MNRKKCVLVVVVVVIVLVVLTLVLGLGLGLRDSGAPTTDHLRRRIDCYPEIRWGSNTVDQGIDVKTFRFKFKTKTIKLHSHSIVPCIF